MELEGTFRGGHVILDNDAQLPDGTRVKVEVSDATAPKPLTHYDLFREIIGKAVGLPEDFALNHTHYIRGGPKK